MWLMTQEGFYSIVMMAGSYGPRKFMVRSRQKQDLENMRSLLAKQKVYLPEVVSTPEADYPFRLIVTASEKNAIIAYLGDEIDYSNFKDRVHHRPDQAGKNSAYMEIWSVMRRTQFGSFPNPQRAGVAVKAVLDDFDRQHDPFYESFYDDQTKDKSR